MAKIGPDLPYLLSAFKFLEILVWHYRQFLNQPEHPGNLLGLFRI